MGNSPAKDVAAQSKVPELIFIHGDRRAVKASYKVVKELDAGGFGKVYLVTDTHGNSYALKLFRNLAREDEEEAQKEVQMLRKISHHNVVTYHSSFTLNENGMHALCIVMEFVPGLDLDSAIKNCNKPPPVERVMALFIELIEALKFLHSHRVAHRDIKPANILLITNEDKYRMIKMTDFGLARKMKHTNATAGGTLPYLAPEVLFPAIGRATLKVDIWALGLVLYEVLTLDDSFKNPLGWLGCIRDDPKILEKKVTDVGLRSLLEMMLDPNPESRKSAEDLINSDIIQGWKIALDIQHPKRDKCPETILGLSPYISLLDRKTSPALIAGSLKMIASNFDNSSFCNAFLGLNGVERLCHLLNGKNSLKSEASIQSKQAQELTSKSLPAELENAVIATIGSFCNRTRSGGPSAIQIYASGCIPFIIERLKTNPASVALLLSSLCRYSVTHTELMYFGMEYILSGHLRPSSFKEEALYVYEELQYHTESVSLSQYFRHVLEKTPRRAIKHVRDLLWARKESHTLINNTNESLFGRIILHCHKELSQGFSNRWFAGLCHATFPLEKMLMDQIRSSCCTLGVTGRSNLVQQYLCRCSNPKCPDGVLRCLSCAKRCHPQSHSFEVILIKDYCHCARSDCNSRSEIPAPRLVARENTNLLPPSHSYHDIPGILVLPGAKYKFQVCSAMPNFYQVQNQGAALRTNLQPDEIQFYFELHIHKLPFISGKFTCSVAVGLMSKNSPHKQQNDHMLGWLKEQCGYHSDDGKFFYQTGRGQAYGPQYANGDVVGCGITGDCRLFFTLNGFFLGYTGVTLPADSIQYAGFSCFGEGAEITFSFSEFMYSANPTDVLSLNKHALNAIFQDRNSIGKAMTAGIQEDPDKLEPIAALLVALKTKSPSAYQALIREFPNLNHLSSSRKIHEFLSGSVDSRRKSSEQVNTNVTVAKDRNMDKRSPIVIDSRDRNKSVDDDKASNPSIPNVAGENPTLMNLMSNPEILQTMQSFIQMAQEQNVSQSTATPASSISSSPISVDSRKSFDRSELVSSDSSEKKEMVNLFVAYKDQVEEIAVPSNSSLRKVKMEVVKRFHLKKLPSLAMYEEDGEVVVADDASVQDEAYLIVKS